MQLQCAAWMRSEKRCGHLCVSRESWVAPLPDAAARPAAQVLEKSALQLNGKPRHYPVLLAVSLSLSATPTILAGGGGVTAGAA
jgi:hypothetical protein